MNKKILLIVLIISYCFPAFRFGCDASKNFSINKGRLGNYTAENSIVIGYEHRLFGIEYVSKSDVENKYGLEILSLYGQYHTPISNDIKAFIKIGISNIYIQDDFHLNNSPFITAGNEDLGYLAGIGLNFNNNFHLAYTLHEVEVVPTDGSGANEVSINRVTFSYLLPLIK